MTNLKEKQMSNESELIAYLSLYMQGTKDERDFFDRLFGLMTAYLFKCFIISTFTY